VRQFVDAGAAELGITLEWQGEGVEETGHIAAIDADKMAAFDLPAVGTGLEPGHVIVRVDPRYFRPTEVETLLGDPTKAREQLGWSPKISFKELIAEMVREDLKTAARDELVKRHGYVVYDYHE
jgi:GDPmannose 4,6-dehydratase